MLGEAALPKTIVLTGAMVPYIFNNSDAVFNLGCAVTAVQLLPRGVFVAMNGRVFDWDKVRKNKELGVFEAGGGLRSCGSGKHATKRTFRRHRVLATVRAFHSACACAGLSACAGAPKLVFTSHTGDFHA